MKRRTFLGMIAGSLLAAPLAAEAQQQVGKPSRMGVLLNLYPPDALPPQALRQRLRDLGYVEGRNVEIEYRDAEGKYERLPASRPLRSPRRPPHQGRDPTAQRHARS